MVAPRDAYGRFVSRGKTGRPIKKAAQLGTFMEAAVSHVVRRFQLRLWQVETSATPVDLGWARAGWTPSAGSPVAEQVDRPKGRSAVEAAAAARLAANKAKALEIANTYRVRQGKVFLTNSVVYLPRLNEGYSAQAPAKFIERGIEQSLQSFGDADT